MPVVLISTEKAVAGNLQRLSFVLVVFKRSVLLILISNRGFLSGMQEILVQPDGFHQFFVGAGLDNLSFCNHQDLVGVYNGVQPVGDDDDRFSRR